MTEFVVKRMSLGRKEPRNCGTKLWACFDVAVDGFRFNNCAIFERPDGKLIVRPPMTKTSLGNVRAVKFTAAVYIEFHQAAMEAYWAKIGCDPDDAGMRRTLRDEVREMVD